MKYRITHTTVYHYSQPVGLCQNEARLQPRNFWRQNCHSSRLDIKPTPTDFRERIDFFGNRVAYFATQQSHTQLIVTAISEVTIFSRQSNLDMLNQMTWEQARGLLQETTLQVQSQSQQGQSPKGTDCAKAMTHGMLRCLETHVGTTQTLNSRFPQIRKKRQAGRTLSWLEAMTLLCLAKARSAAWRLRGGSVFD